MVLTDELRVAVGCAAREELARRSLTGFASHVDSNYVIARHVRYVAEHLEALERGEIKHIIVLIPPRHGKTRLVSQLFPAWWLGRHPSDELILASNTSDLAEDNSAKSRDLLQGDRYPFETRVAADTSAKSLWRTTAGGVVRAAGVGSAIQGRGGNLLVCDDPIAGAEDATESAFERQWKWFTQDFFPRRLSDSHVVLSMFRWGDADLAGRILAHEDPDFRKDWTVVSLPAYAREEDSLGRAVGEVLWPTMVTPNGRKVGYDREFLETQRRMDSRSWAAQYLLDPIPQGTAIFKADWLKRRYRELPLIDGGSFGHRNYFTLQAIDGAWKTGVTNDYSVIATWKTNGIDAFLWDVWRQRVEFPSLRRAVIEQHQKHRPNLVLCEEAASGFALLQELRATTGIPIVGVVPGSSKEARAEAVAPIFEAGKVVLPESAPWLDAWITEHLRFPGARYDDQVDTTSLALSRLFQAVAQQAIAARRVTDLSGWMIR